MLLHHIPDALLDCLCPLLFLLLLLYFLLDKQDIQTQKRELQKKIKCKKVLVYIVTKVNDSIRCEKRTTGIIGSNYKQKQNRLKEIIPFVFKFMPFIFYGNLFVSILILKKGGKLSKLTKPLS